MPTKKISVLSICLIFVIIISSANAQMIAEITKNVQTEFGTYHPYSVSFTPNVPTFSVEPDFNNVVNFENFKSVFNSVDSAFLFQNHFVVKKCRYQQLYDLYNMATWGGEPIFVTTDAVLHIYHVLFDHFLSEIELQKFVATLNDMTEALIIETQSQFNQSSQAEVKEATRRNLAFLYVAKKLLNGNGVTVPDAVSALVDSELVLISNHDGYHISPILGKFSALE